MILDSIWNNFWTILGLVFVKHDFQKLLQKSALPCSATLKQVPINMPGAYPKAALICGVQYQNWTSLGNIYTSFRKFESSIIRQERDLTRPGQGLANLLGFEGLSWAVLGFWEPLFEVLSSNMLKPSNSCDFSYRVLHKSVLGSKC